MTFSGTGEPGPAEPGPTAERWGLLGGTFDPVHYGHLAAARAAWQQLGLDRVLLVVANDPWQKTPERPITPARLRLHMVEAACRGEPGLEPSSVEIDRGGPSYTVDTVREVLARGVEPVVIVGADLVATLRTWERWEQLRRLAPLAVVTRSGRMSPDLHRLLQGWRWQAVTGVDVDVSSSGIRRRLREGEPIEGTTPPAVIHCIRRHDLYAGGG